MAVQYIVVQIPFHIYMAIKPSALRVEEHAQGEVEDFLEWKRDCYICDDTNKVVKYYLGDMELPDSFGVVYTYFLSMTGLDRTLNSLNT